MSDLEMMRGDTQEWLVVTKRDGTAVDITSAKLWFTARKYNASGTVVFSRTSDVGGGITIDPDQVTNRGKATIKLRNEDTASLPSSRTILFYDVQVKLGTDIWTVVSGNLAVNPDSTTEIA